VEQDMESSMKEAEESIKNSVEENQGDEVNKA